ncbi:unnamed protein product [Polarella glacialis]|uniref:Uncharacterized protein n=1 Tax=Polarella glacialis TaxID=89957 RepID=A0A813I2Y8_POLGL|nr:unnamed protein product [Polarella glacialis]
MMIRQNYSEPEQVVARVRKRLDEKGYQIARLTKENSWLRHQLTLLGEQPLAPKSAPNGSCAPNQGTQTEDPNLREDPRIEEEEVEVPSEGVRRLLPPSAGSDVAVSLAVIVGFQSQQFESECP